MRGHDLGLAVCHLRGSQLWQVNAQGCNLPRRHLQVCVGTWSQTQGEDQVSLGVYGDQGAQRLLLRV